MPSSDDPSVVADATSVLDSISELFIATDREWRITYVNKRAEQYFAIVGLRRASVLGTVLWDRLPFLVDTPFQLAALRALAEGSELEVEAELPGMDGWFVCRIVPTPGGVVSYSRDVTARHRAEEAARTNAELINALMRSATDAIFAKDLGGRYIMVNDAAARALGRSIAEVIGRSDVDLFPADAARMVQEHDRQLVRTGAVGMLETSFMTPDGWRIFHSKRSLFHDAAGRPAGILVIARDVTDRRREELAQRVLADATAALNSTLDLNETLAAVARMAVPALADCCFVDLLDDAGQIQRVDLACHDEETAAALLPLARRYPPSRDWEDHVVSRAIRSGEPVLIAELTREARARVARSAEHLEYLDRIGAHSLISAPLVVRGETLGVLTFCFTGPDRRYDAADVSLARELASRAALAVVNARLYTTAQAELARRAQAEADLTRWAHIFQHAGWGVAVSDPTGTTYEAVNPTFARMHGYDAGELVGQPLTHLAAAAAREAVATSIQVARERGRVVFETRHVTRDAVEFPVLTELTAVRDEAGVLEYLAVNVQDLTERERAEQQVRQSQKMEALGRLAGGVAHDFNNVLMVIIGFADFLASGLDADDPRRTDAEEIRKAAERAAALTRQLLAFGRPRVMRTQVIEINDVVRDMELMLRSVVGEQIRLVLALQPGLGGVQADRGQLEQLVMNLTLNARDAMSEGGRLEIRSAEIVFEQGEAYRATGIDIAPGEYVTLVVSDRGHGMDADTRARIFEPFFSTRHSSQNSGLGLAIVYGIVNQCGGHIWVDSEPGMGTTFTLCFPRAGVPDETPAASPAATAPGGSETILVAEDEEILRSLAVRILSDAGYGVITARDGREAFGIARDEHELDLVLTDIVMPGMTGVELAEGMASERPDLPILFMSGYTGADVLRQDAAIGAAAFLQKPFSADSLLHTVRRVLDGRIESTHVPSGHRSHNSAPDGIIVNAPAPVPETEE